MQITSKGQVTIPQDIREKLGLLPDTAVEFDTQAMPSGCESRRGRPAESAARHRGASARPRQSPLFDR